MVDVVIGHELAACLDQMPVEQQRQVLEFAQRLAAVSPPGTPGVHLLPFVGTIDESDLDAMSQAIEQGCERIDADEW